MTIISNSLQIPTKLFPVRKWKCFDGKKDAIIMHTFSLQICNIDYTITCVLLAIVINSLLRAAVT